MGFVYFRIYAQTLETLLATYLKERFICEYIRILTAFNRCKLKGVRLRKLTLRMYIRICAQTLETFLWGNCTWIAPSDLAAV